MRLVKAIGDGREGRLSRRERGRHAGGCERGAWSAELAGLLKRCEGRTELYLERADAALEARDAVLSAAELLEEGVGERADEVGLAVGLLAEDAGESLRAVDDVARLIELEAERVELLRSE